ncbi:MAG: biotin/lipoyl-binding protein [Alphaproteobacteria bacterium]|nr:biotin/lipoyl-binding protein [Alphaproteobacteria bacterium]
MTLLLLAWMLGCAEPAAAPTTRETPADPVRWEAAQPATSVVLARLPAEVVPAPDGVLALGPRVPLRVLSWEVQPGDLVEAGDAIARVDSPAFEALARAAPARAAVREAARTRLGTGVGTAADLAAAEADAAEVAAAWEAGRAELARSGTGLVWRSPTRGRVQRLTCPAGQEVDPHTACVELVATTAPRVQVHVPEHLLPRLDQPQGSLHLAGTQAPVALVWLADAPALDAASRTRTAWLQPAPGEVVADDALLVGRSGRLDLVVPAPPGAVRLPSRAVVRLDGQDVVFRGPAGVPTAVTVLGREADDVVLASADLAPGTDVAVTGVLLLKTRHALEED